MRGLTGFSQKEIEEAFVELAEYNYRNLQQLDLSGFNLSDNTSAGPASENIKEIEEAFVELAEDNYRNLQRLDLSGSNLSDNNSADPASENIVDAFARYTIAANFKKNSELSPAAKALQEYIEGEIRFYKDQNDIYKGIISDLDQMRLKVQESDSLNPHAKTDFLKLIQDQMDGWKKKKEELPSQSPEAHYGIYESELERYMQDYAKGRIIKTPYVNEKIAEITEALQTKGVVIIGGHTGLGKTEIARLVAKDITGKEPVVVRGHPDMDSSEMFGSHKLEKSNDISPHQVLKIIDREVQKFQKKNPSITEEELKTAREIITQKVCNDNSVTISRYIMKGVYKALRDGRVCIIDEGNYIDPGLMAKLNDILTKKAGEFVYIQEDGGEKLELKSDPKIIITGNFNQNGKKIYSKRVELDPALLDRAGFVNYGALPQETLGSLSDCRDPLQKQLFTILIVPLMTCNGGFILPKRTNVETLWNFAQLASISQLAFAGKLDGTHPLAPQKDGVSYTFEPTVQLSNRRVISIIESWRDEGFIYPLDYYLYRDLNHIQDKSERFFLYSAAQKAGLFQGEEWPTAESFRDDFPSPPKMRVGDIEVRPLSEIVDAIFGAPPVRKSWGGIETHEYLNAISEAERELEELVKICEKIIKDEEMLEHLRTVCPI
jgi:MoxR-like ATPase